MFYCCVGLGATELPHWLLLFITVCHYCVVVTVTAVVDIDDVVRG